MVVKAVGKTFTKLFGSRNERLVKGYSRRAANINALEPEIQILTDAELRAKTAEFRQRITDGERGISIMPEIMAVAREVMDRSVGIRSIFNPENNFDPSQLPSDVQATYERVKQQMEQTEPADVLGGETPIPGWMQVEIPNTIYDAIRKIYPLSKPPYRARPFDVQLIGGMVLGEGRIAEMKTGEGKTIVGPLACYVACCDNLQCHVVTVNDYLVQRDRDWVFPFYHWMGLSVGAIHPFHMQPPEGKAAAYNCDVVYGTNSEFGFDYLRDNMKIAVEQQVQKRRDFCIIDEVDSILIDEARTPLIISGPAHDDAPRYELADNLARHLINKQKQWNVADQKVQQLTMRITGLEGEMRNARDKARIAAMRAEREELESQLPAAEAERDQFTQYYEIEREKRASHLTHDGISEAQKEAGVGSFYVGSNMDMPHLLENALRAHTVYQRDKEYVIQGGEVVIVDEFTGRLMVGRQWSDGLHQAVEAKEKVKIKQETQTLATVTIQNFFKLYKRLAGMTGTAITESTEFMEIYGLDVVSIPTNVPVIRDDRDDLIFLAEKDKWNAIIDEIKRVHDVGRPVLVGTTSVENSEKISTLLEKKYSIQHAVLNAKQHEREAHIVQNAGGLGAVMIATNMAGRGTDIKLAQIDRAALVEHWQRRNLLPSDAKADMADEKLIDLAQRHIASWSLGMKPKEIEPLDSADVRHRLLLHWAETEAWYPPEKAAKLNDEQLVALIDKYAAGFMLHRLEIFTNIQQMGGLHIVGTERHEARRIDNQLRGRAGRQGDKGSSRFFISLEDDLMQMFAQKTTLNVLSKLGMKEGDAIEHKWLTRSVERAQRKVEERNYEIRKSLLEYDEVMEHQRNDFYSTRQQVLEGRRISDMIFGYIEAAVDDAVGTYLDRDYVATQIAEWCRQTLDVSVDPARLGSDDVKELQQAIGREAQADVSQVIDVTLGEYMSIDLPADEWDLKGLSAWAMSRFNVDLKQNQLRNMSPEEVKKQLTEAALDQLQRKDMSGLQKFLEPLYGEKDLVEWCSQQFDVTLEPEPFGEDTEPQQSIDRIIGTVRDTYHRRELEYPAQFIIDMVQNTAQQDREFAVGQLLGWVKSRYDMDWTVEDLRNESFDALQAKVIAEAELWWADGGKLETTIDDAIARHRDPQALADWAKERFNLDVDVEVLEDKSLRRERLLNAGRQHLRYELTQLERYVLLQILDTAWKDHLYSMDQLKDSVGLRGYAEKDPRIEYKREGANQYRQMLKVVRDRVTALIFHARLSGRYEHEQRNVYGDQEAHQDDAAAASAMAGTGEQRADLEAAQMAGSRGEDDQNLSRRERRARAAQSGQSDTSGGGTRRRGLKARRKRR